jgi:tetratricopeptide (TPR) repeat protein
VRSVDEPDVRVLLRCAAGLLAIPALAFGVVCVLLAFGGEQGAQLVQTALARVPSDSGAGAPLQLAGSLAQSLAKGRVAAAPIAIALILLGYAFWPARRRAPRPRAAPAAKGAPQAKARPQNETPVLSRKERKKILKQAQQLGATSGPEGAGDFLLGFKLYDEAIAEFQRAELWERVAEVRHDQNRFEESAKLYEKAGKPESAGSIWAQLERFDHAARCYLAADKRSVAGEMFERAGKHEDAARCYRDIGFHRHAAKAFLLANRELEAAQCLVQAFAEDGGDRISGNDPKGKELRAIAKKAADLFLKLGKLGEAEGILVRAGALQQAAQVATHAGAHARAAELFQKLGKPELAAQALERAGDKVGAARLKGQHLRDTGDDEGAARSLREAGDLQEAGDLFRKLGQFGEAAECYSSAKDWGAAAEMYRVGGQHEKASEAFQHGGDLAKAAEQAALAGDLERHAAMLEQAGQLYEAGASLVEQGKPDQAIRLLQRVEPNDPNYRAACAALGKLFGTKGMHSLSIAKLELAAGPDPVSKQNVDATFDLACALEQRGEHERAIEVFERILAYDYHYRDAATRLARAKDTRRAADAEVGTDPSLPKVGGRYQVIRELGRGGMGVVYLARDTVLERDVAYKVLPEGLRESPNALRKFLREAKAAAQLNHPNIVTVYDAGESEHGFYLAMEFVDGTTLKEVLQRKGAIAPGGVLYVLRQLADALAYAHSRKVVHRDVKTANTMWTAAKQVKIMDFGLAKLMEEVRNATTLVSGTPFYMSPEQTLGRDVDHRTDIYSLGVTLFELATGQLPFRKGNVPYHHVHTPPPDPREINPRVPEALSKIILRCLEKDPARRYATAKEIVEEVDRLGTKA